VSRNVLGGVGFSVISLATIACTVGPVNGACQHLVGHCRERVHVAARIDHLLAHRLLGTHVLRRAEREPGLRHPLAAGTLHRERDAEISHQRMAALEQDVLGLDVAMDDTLVVRVLEGVGNLTGDQDGVGDGKLLHALEAGAQRLARDEGHDVEEVGAWHASPLVIPCGAGVQQRQDVRMLQARRGADLGEEAFRAERGAEFRMQHLDRDVTIVLEVAGEVHGGHAADAELADEGVAVGQCGGEAGLHAHRGAADASASPTRSTMGQ
jgi:hypothetical protein